MTKSLHLTPVTWLLRCRLQWETRTKKDSY